MELASRPLLKFVCTQILNPMRYDKLILAKAGAIDKTQRVRRFPTWLYDWLVTSGIRVGGRGGQKGIPLVPTGCLKGPCLGTTLLLSMAHMADAVGLS